MADRKRSESRQRTAFVAVRFLPEELQAIDDTAAEIEWTRSRLIRAAALQACGYTSTSDGER